MGLTGRCALRSLTVLVTAALGAALVAPVAASAAPSHLVGRVNVAHQSGSNHIIGIVGWLQDTSRPTTSVHVSVLVDGRRARVALTNLYRADVNKRQHSTGNHGFRVLFTAKAGAKTVVLKGWDNKGPAVAALHITQILPPAGSRIIAEAKKFVGRTPYVDGGTSPTRGFDCSGYTQYVYRLTGVANLPRTAEQQRHAVRLIPRSQARAGDLVFYLSGGSAFHIAIYAGNGKQYAAATPSDGIVYQGVWSSAVQYGTTWH